MELSTFGPILPPGTEPSPGRVIGEAATGAGAGSKAPNQAWTLPLNQVFPGPQAAPDLSMTGIIDRVRADFESFRLRLQRQSEQSQSAAAYSSDATQRLVSATNEMVRLQVDLMELSMSAHAGLSAAHHGQNGVKTLIEKA